ncbi:MAG: TIGR03546 family protein [Nitrospirota bacterium]
MIKMIANLLKILNSDANPSQISAALGFGLISGLLPFFSPASLVVLFIVFLLRVNLSAYLLGTAFFSGLAYLLDPLLHRIGLLVLTAAPLEGLWTTLYNLTLWRVQKFNNSVVMGGLVFGILCFAPLVLLANALIRRYREHVLAWVKKSRLMQAFTASKFYDIYMKVSGWGWGGLS